MTVTAVVFTGDFLTSATPYTSSMDLPEALRGYRALLDRGLRPVAVAGHGAGEYAALVAAGALAEDEAAAALAVREQAVARAAAVHAGGMLAVHSRRADRLARASIAVADLCPIDEFGNGTVVIGQCNGPEYVVVSGHRASLPHVAMNVVAGGGRADAVRSAAALHSPLMRPASAVLDPALAALTWSRPTVPVVTALDGRHTQDPSRLRTALGRQLAEPLRWDLVNRTLADLGVEEVVEVGCAGPLPHPLTRENRSARGGHSDCSADHPALDHAGSLAAAGR